MDKLPAARKLIIQIPCYNEQTTLGETLASLPRKVDGFSTVEFLVVGDDEDASGLVVLQLDVASSL